MDEATKETNRWIREFSDFTGMKVFDDGKPAVKRFTLIN